MEKKIYPVDCITLDGRMDEPVWNEVPTYTDFRHLKDIGGALQEVKTYFKIIPCEDRIYIGVKCMEPDIAYAIDHWEKNKRGLWAAPGVQLFLSPAGKSFDYYQFVVTWFCGTGCYYYSEGGNIQPDPYAPQWRAEVYTGEDYWSTEIEFPLSAFYMTPHDQWSDEWLVNVCRIRLDYELSTWSPLNLTFMESENYRSLGGFPMLAKENDICINNAVANLTEETPNGYEGTLTVKTTNAVAGEFEFSSDHGETVRVSLNAGSNEFAVPCFFAETGRANISLSLKRLSDGVEFKRHYPVRAFYEPIKIVFTKPGYRSDFYPGQDYSKIAGQVITGKPVTLVLEGPGIEKQTLHFNGNGEFSFDTANFEIGTACLTATIDGYELTKRIRRLAPSGHTMTWIEDGNIYCDGEPVLPRTMYGPGYLGGKVFNEKYFSNEQYTTDKFVRANIQMKYLIRGSETTGGECMNDAPPTPAMIEKIDAFIDNIKDTDFGYYYLTDEPECRGVSPIYLKYAYEHIIERDPYHVVMIAIRGAAPYIECADWFQTHPYTCPYVNEDGSRVYKRPTSTAGSFVDDVVNLNRMDKCIGYLPTCFSFKFHNKNYDYPTFDEYISNTWAAMIHGGKSLWPYAFHDINDRAAMYEGTRYLFASFMALEKIVLFGKRTRLYRTDLGEAVLYECEDEKLLVVVNFTQQEQTYTLDGVDAVWHDFRSDRVVNGNTFTVKGNGVFIGTNTVKGADLPTYDETLALIDRLEYERTHRGSLVFDRWDEIKVDHSRSYEDMGWRLFDGVIDNYSLVLRVNDEMYTEIDLTKVKPTFTKVVVHGYNVADLTLKVRFGNELEDADIAEFTADNNQATIVLKAAICPDRVRFAFNNSLAQEEKKEVELYEIELF